MSLPAFEQALRDGLPSEDEMLTQAAEGYWPPPTLFDFDSPERQQEIWDGLATIKGILEATPMDEWPDFKPEDEGVIGERLVQAFAAGQRGGRTHAVKLGLCATAPTVEDAEKLLADLDTHGIALQAADGSHIPAPPRNGARIDRVKWDEESRPHDPA